MRFILIEIYLQSIRTKLKTIKMLKVKMMMPIATVAFFLATLYRSTTKETGPSSIEIEDVSIRTVGNLGDTCTSIINIDLNFYYQQQL